MKKLLIIIWLLPCLPGCTKYLDKKQDGSITTPSSLDDLQAMLDYNYMANFGIPVAGEIGSDNFYITDEDWKSVSHSEQQYYIWGDDMFNEYDDNDWNNPYQAVLYGNVVLEELGKIEPGTDEKETWNSIEGSSLFLRAHAFYWLAQEFCRPYNESTAGSDPGIPLRLTSDINAPSQRASVKDGYRQIIADLKEAIPLLPVQVAYKTRPCRPAAYALLARTFLSMQDYGNARLYADSCLLLHNKLFDYNNLNAGDYNPVPRFNDEVLFQCILLDFSITYPPTAKVDAGLYAMYADNDLRKTIFFKPNSDGSYSFYGSYDGTDSKFSGIATDEVYFIRAECAARMGDRDNALKDLNAVLVNRYRTGSFIPVTAATAEEALNSILTERRKELVWRGLRWPDLRRLNTDSRFAITITRNADGEDYVLKPGDTKYVLQIPQKVIQLSGIEQNPR